MIHLEHLRFGYGRRRTVFDGLTLDLPAGEIVGLLGANGTGKSTLLKLLAGLLAPEAGRIDVAGFRPPQPPADFYRSVLLVPEEFALPAVTLDRFVRATAPFYPAFSAAAFDEGCARLEVDRDRSLDTLSMGQRKKGYLAFALACNVPLLLLDEPTTGLDIPARSTLRSMLAAQVEPGRTVIVSTHAARDIESLIDRAVILDRQNLLLSERIDRLTAVFGFGPAEGRQRLLYAEPSPAGDRGVWIADGPDEGRFDLELLFNAAVHAAPEVVAALKKQPNASCHESL